MKKLLTVLFNSKVDENFNLEEIKQNSLNFYNGLLTKFPLSTASYKNIERFDYNSLGLGKNLVSLPKQIDEYLSFLENSKDKNIEYIKQNSEKKVHIIVSMNEFSSQRNIENILKIYNFLAVNSFAYIYFHIITEKTENKMSAINYINSINSKLNGVSNAYISTICGSNYALDKDNNFAKTKKYYDLIVNGKGDEVLSYEKSILSLYEKNIYDEDIKPIIVTKKGNISNGDIVFWMNDNPSESKQILEALKNPEYPIFETKPMNDLICFTFFDLSSKVNIINLLNEANSGFGFANYLSMLSLSQARVCSLNGYNKIIKAFDNTDKKITHLDNYIIDDNDESYEIKCAKMTKKVLNLMQQDYDFILINYLNDIIDYKKKGENFNRNYLIFDACLNKLFEYAQDNFYDVVILFNEENGKYNNINYTICDKKISFKEDSQVYDAMPTILDYMDLSIPVEMTGKSILNNEE